MKEDEMSEKYKKALRLAAVMGCGFEGDAEDAAELLTLITGLESRIAELREDNASLGDSNAWLKQNYEDLERDYGVMYDKMCARIDKLKGVIEILEDQQREAKNHLIDKNLHIDSLYEEGYKLQQRIAELEADGIHIEWMNEDELPEEISDEVYSTMYACSVIDFVRFFPFVTINGHKRFLIELPEREE